jgi:hypothetical protein
MEVDRSISTTKSTIQFFFLNFCETINEISSVDPASQHLLKHPLLQGFFLPCCRVLLQLSKDFCKQCRYCRAGRDSLRTGINGANGQSQCRCAGTDPRGRGLPMSWRLTAPEAASRTALVVASRLPRLRRQQSLRAPVAEEQVQDGSDKRAIAMKGK